MDQLKVFLKQCVKYRFWIAFGISILLPAVGYAVGFGAINQVTTKREGEIKGAKADVEKYRTPGIVNGQYQPVAATKKEVLVQDVDATWRKLFASQESLLNWPPEVQERFRKWGRKYPTDVDGNQVRSTLIDYAVAYPEFVSKIYKVFKPFNFEDGTGIVVAPDEKILLSEASYSQDSPPELSKVWAEQERLWIVTALLDVIAKVNDGVGAKDWNDAIVKQIMLLEVGAATDQDQKSIAQGKTLVVADTLSPDGTTAPAAPAAPAGMPPGMESMMGGMVPGGATKSNEVMYLATESPQFKALPIKMTVLVDQARLPYYLIGLENSPMAIQVNEVEIAKPLVAVSKPVAGERGSMNMGMMGGMPGARGDEMMMGGMGMSMPGGRGRPGGAPTAGGSGPGAGYGDMMAGMMGGGGGRGVNNAAAASKKGVDNRTVNAAKDRQKKLEKEKKDASKSKVDTKKIDQYYNVIEVTVYGQARFYLAPPAPVQPPPSTAPEPTPTPAPTPAPEAAKAEAPQPPPAADAAKKDEPPKAEAPKAEAPEAPKVEAPKVEAPGGTPKPGEAPAKP